MQIYSTDLFTKTPSNVAFDIQAAIERATTTLQLDELAKATWSAFTKSLIPIGVAEALTGRIETLREAKRAYRRQLSLFPSQRRSPAPRRPITPERTLRRRRNACSNALPANLAALYTPHQLAAVSVVVTLLRNGTRAVERTLQEIADIAGVSRKTAQRALRLANTLGHLSVEERRIHKNKNLPHRITLGSDPLLRKWVEFRAARLPDRGSAEADHKKQLDSGYCKRPDKAPPGQNRLFGEVVGADMAKLKRRDE